MGAKQFFLRNVLVNTRKQVSWHRCRQRVVKTHGAFHLTLIFEESGMSVTALGVQLGICMQCLWLISVILLQVGECFFIFSLRNGGWCREKSTCDHCIEEFMEIAAMKSTITFYS